MAQWPTPPEIEIYCVLQPRFLLLDFAGAAEAFRLANDYGGRFRLRYVGPDAAPANSLGLPIHTIDPLPDSLPEGAWVMLSGVTESAKDYTLPAAKTTRDWLKRTFRPNQHTLVCVCSGALLAGMAGLLDGRRCTTHHTLTARLAQQSPKADVLENRIFVEDGPIHTSAGVTAGVDLALHLIARHAGPAVALAVAREMVVYLRREGNDVQLSPWLANRNHLHPAVHRAQDLIAQDPQRHWPVSELAERVHVSPRHLARLFAQHAGLSIIDYQHRLRVALARERLERGESVECAAQQAGFGSARSLRRVWQKFEHLSPGAVRTRA